MHFSILSLGLLLEYVLASPVSLNSRDAALDQFYSLATEANVAQAALVNASSTCNSSNIVVRKPWGSLSETDRKGYTDAVLCLQSLPPKTPLSLVPGVRSRFDDFVAAHMNQTLTIHETGSFLSWHRWFVYNYELALKNECGYNGTQPYWNWGLYASDPASSPIFDGSDYSLSGDGEYIAGRGDLLLDSGDNVTIHRAAGTGGGCITSGPFKNMTVTLGPMSLPVDNGTTITGSITDVNLRCLSRDLSAAVNQDFANSTSVINLITEHDDIASFQDVMQGVLGSGDLGVHGGGHYVIGGDPASDVYISPNDPVFYLHHGMIDLVWWVWQLMDFDNRQFEISGTRTFRNSPASDNATMDDIIDLGYAGGYPITIRELTSTIDGPLCYTYDI
ncbi:tyrosinase [Xylariales sp. AK1849]|nr:tyrosinase [Xylariales sp. AK1849]